MRHRKEKKRACVLAWLCLLAFAVPLAVVGAIWEREAIFVFAVLVGLPCILIIAIIGVSSSALKRDFGLHGDKMLFECPDALRNAKPIITSARIGQHYIARGLLPIAWADEGIAITLDSQDIVFIAKANIECARHRGRWCEITHCDPQLQSPIMILREVALQMRPLLGDVMMD